VFDIGLGEIMLLAVVGLLVFGPEKLPKAAADAGRLVRQLREMATGARRDLAESAGLDLSDAQSALKDLADLHPRRLMSGLMSDVDPAPAARKAPGAAAPAPPPAGAAGGAAFDPDAT
jgi:sec-independent protein translocase protein TatB